MVRKILTMALTFGMVGNILVPAMVCPEESAETVWTELDDNKTMGTAETVDVASVSLDDLCKASNTKSVQSKRETYSTYLSQIVEADFTGMEGIESADATVTYNVLQDQYSIELSLAADGDINEGQAELYKSFLRKTYAEVTLTINGVLR